MVTVVCAIGKNENRYIREFVEHYKKIGFDYIFLFDNNDIDGEHFEDVIGDEINNGFVRLIDVRGLKPSKGGDSIQMKCYNAFYLDFYKEIDWVGFFDIDEFLTLPEGMNIKDYLMQDKFNSYALIHFQWICYDDNDLLYYEDKPLQERFTRRCGDGSVGGCENNKHVKSMVRGKLVTMTFNYTPHSPLTWYPCCNADGSKVLNSLYPLNHSYDVDGMDETKVAYIKHFCTKTIEEYFKKRERGFPDNIKENTDRIITPNEFFKWNQWTQEKEDLWNKLIEEK